jgi:hypothetical protein
MNITAKQFKQGYLYIKNGYSIHYKGGFYYFGAFNNSAKFKTLKDVKNHIKTTLTN